MPELLCIECGETFRSRKDLQLHQSREHQFRRDDDSDSDAGATEGNRQSATEHAQQQQSVRKNQLRAGRGTRAAGEPYDATLGSFGQHPMQQRGRQDRSHGTAAPGITDPAGFGAAVAPVGELDQGEPQPGRFQGRSARNSRNARSKPDTMSSALHGQPAADSSLQPHVGHDSTPDAQGIRVMTGRQGQGRGRHANLQPSPNPDSPAAAQGPTRNVLRRPVDLATKDNHSIPGPTVGTLPGCGSHLDTSNNSHPQEHRQPPSSSSKTLSKQPRPTYAAAEPQVLQVSPEEAAAAATAAILGTLNLRPRVRPTSALTQALASGAGGTATSSEATASATEQGHYASMNGAHAVSQGTATAVDKKRRGRQQDGRGKGGQVEDGQVEGAGEHGGEAIRDAVNTLPGNQAEVADGGDGGGKGEGKGARRRGSRGLGRAKLESAGQDAGKVEAAERGPGEGGQADMQGQARGKRQGAGGIQGAANDRRGQAADEAAVRDVESGAVMVDGAGDTEGPEQSEKRGPSKRMARARERKARAAAEVDETQGAAGAGDGQAPRPGAVVEGGSGDADMRGKARAPLAARIKPGRGREGLPAQDNKGGRRSQGSITFFTCPTCGSNFYSPVVLRHHVRSDHPGVALEEGALKRSSVTAAPVSRRAAGFAEGQQEGGEEAGAGLASGGAKAGGSQGGACPDGGPP